MFDPASIINKAKRSSLYLKLLNFSLGRMIPFNKPHGFRIIELSDSQIKARIPYARKNLNHIRGLHACALATISEFTTGFFLITKLDAKKYRIIMQRLEMDYYYQGKMDAVAEFGVSTEWLTEKIYSPLQDHDAVLVACSVRINDIMGNHLTTGKVFWQIKNWEKVKTKA